jgi:YD repeat-containing protein
VFQSFDASTNSSSPAGQLQVYSSDGFPIGVREAANGLVGTIYSQVLSLSPRGQVRRERYHESNNLVSDRQFENNTGRLAQISSGVSSNGINSGSLQRWDYRWDKNGSLSERHDQTNGASHRDRQREGSALVRSECSGLLGDRYRLQPYGVCQRRGDQRGSDEFFTATKKRAYQWPNDCQDCGARGCRVY